MNETDWLAVPKEDGEAEKNSPEQEAALAVIDDAERPPRVSKAGLIAFEKHSAARAEFVRAWKTLSLRQQVYLRALQRNGFRHAAALKTVNAAVTNDPVAPSSTKVTWNAPARWTRESSEYRLVLAALKTEAATQVTSRDDLLLRAHRAAEYAEEEQPILFQGNDTGFRERQVGEMLRANEQLMKATKVLGGDESRGSVGGTGPAFVIQVIQRDGAVVDVTPRGVTIDLPPPDGA